MLTDSQVLWGLALRSDCGGRFGLFPYKGQVCRSYSNPTRILPGSYPDPTRILPGSQPNPTQIPLEPHSNPTRTPNSNPTRNPPESRTRIPPESRPDPPRSSSESIQPGSHLDPTWIPPGSLGSNCSSSGDPERMTARWAPSVACRGRSMWWWRSRIPQPGWI